MQKIVIYTKPVCPYCVRAKGLFERKGFSYEEIDIERIDNAAKEMITRSGGRKTVPQIFIGETHVGGNDDLQELERQKKLDPLVLDSPAV